MPSVLLPVTVTVPLLSEDDVLAAKVTRTSPLVSPSSLTDADAPDRLPVTDASSCPILANWNLLADDVAEALTLTTPPTSSENDISGPAA